MEQEAIIGRIRFIRGAPITGTLIARRLSSGSITIHSIPVLGQHASVRDVSISIDGDPYGVKGLTTVLRGSPEDVLGELHERGMHDVVARIDGCDWMVVRGSRPDTMDIIRAGRRVAVIKLPVGSKHHASPVQVH